MKVMTFWKTSVHENFWLISYKYRRLTGRWDAVAFSFFFFAGCLAMAFDELPPRPSSLFLLRRSTSWSSSTSSALPSSSVLACSDCGSDGGNNCRFLLVVFFVILRREEGHFRNSSGLSCSDEQQQRLHYEQRNRVRLQSVSVPEASNTGANEMPAVNIWNPPTSTSVWGSSERESRFWHVKPSKYLNSATE